MADKTTSNPLLKRPLYIFDLPPELIYSLTLHNGSSPLAAPENDSVATVDAHASSAQDNTHSQSTSCSLCGTKYQSLNEQRQHVKSDFHRYNLKLNLKQVPPVDEATFVHMIGDLDESISGSDSDESDVEDQSKNGDSTLSALLKKQAKIQHPEEEETKTLHRRQPIGTAPMLWLTSPKLGDDDTLGIYKAILTDTEQEAASKSFIDILKRKQLTPSHAKHGGKATTGLKITEKDPHYFLCMIGGGHFAAMVVSLVPEIRKGAGGVEERHPIILAHKTFHRYTTRRKQGGSQSANDNAKGNAHSAGSSIRRANEAALELDIRNVLSDWSGIIDSAELIFTRATGSQNRRILFGPYDGQVLNSRDKRNRTFPFSTKRATQSELLRAFQELTRLKASKLVEAIPEPVKTEATLSKVLKPAVEAPKLSKEDDAAKLHTSQLENLIRRSKVPAVLLYYQKNNLPINFSFFPPDEHHHAPTPLHLASATNAAAIVQALLFNKKADPSLKNGDGKAAYELAGDNKTRNAFRVARYQLGEAEYDWASAHVPAAISQADADAKLNTEKNVDDSAEAERRKRELEKLRQQDEIRNVGRFEKHAGSGKSLAAIEKTGAEKREEDMRGLTSEQRQKLERERRARAAEERMRKMAAK